LVLAGTFTALAAERLAARARAPLPQLAGIAALGDIGEFVAPASVELAGEMALPPLRVDPFGGSSAVFPVAPGARTPTVSGRAGRQLTAILIADDRPVAVIDGVVVNLGDVLPDGGRVASIRSDRVAISEKNGQMRVLTLSPGRR
jgi:hypothetical protein